MDIERVIHTIYETETPKGDKTYGVRFPRTGEIRESKDFTTLLQSIVRDHGFYLRKRVVHGSMDTRKTSG